MRRQLIPLFAVVSMLVAIPRAQAQYAVDVVGQTTIGFTSNRNPGAQGDPQSDAFGEAALGVTMLRHSGRYLHAFRWDLTGTLFVQEATASSFSNALAYTGIFDLSPTVRLSLAGSGTQGRQGNFRGDAGAQLAGPTVSGEIWYVGLIGTQRLDWQISPNWEFSESLINNWFIPTYNPFGDAGDNPQGGRTMSADGALGLLRRWQSIALGAQTRSQFLMLFLEDNTGRRWTEQMWIFALTAQLRYDINPRWSVNGEAGVQLAVIGDASGRPRYEAQTAAQPPGPLVTAAVVYQIPSVMITLAAGYQQTPNVQVGQILEGATANLGVRIPLGPARWQLRTESSLGYSFASPVGTLTLANAEADLHNVNADAMLAWRFSDVMEGEFRYRFGWQESFNIPVRSAFANDFKVHVAMLTLRFNYPPRRGPRRALPRVGGGQRADREEWDAIFNPTPGQTPAGGGGGNGGNGGGGNGGGSR